MNFSLLIPIKKKGFTLKCNENHIEDHDMNGFKMSISDFFDQESEESHIEQLYLL